MHGTSNRTLNFDDIAVCVFTSAKVLRERALSVQETWLKAFPRGYLIGGWFADPGLKMISLGEEVGEDYHSAHRKQFLGLVELHRRFPDSAWYYVTGCDAFIFPENLRALLSGYDHTEELLVGGHCGAAVIDGETLIYPGGGPGFALSQALLERLLDKIPDFIVEWEVVHADYKSSCDVALAYLAKRERRVSVSFAEGFYYGPPYYYPRNTYKDGEGNDLNHEVIVNPIAFHNLSIREMYLLQSGRWPKERGFFSKVYDKITRIVTRSLHSRWIMNQVSKILFLRKGRAPAERTARGRGEA